MSNGQKKILIVEDDEVMSKSLAEGLAKFKCEIFEARDGEKAVTMVMDIMPDLILLDLMLPKLDGFKVLERIRRYPDVKIAQIKVVILSNLWSDKDILRAKALKIDEYFVKANTALEEVFAKVKQLMQ
jgi:DNA-binding response OmpR family regulator